jgi:hypothetical protein
MRFSSHIGVVVTFRAAIEGSIFTPILAEATRLMKLFSLHKKLNPKFMALACVNSLEGLYVDVAENVTMLNTIGIATLLLN